MTCDTFENRYLQLDKYERIPLALRMHTVVCPRCRTMCRRMEQTTSVSFQAITASVPQHDPILCSVMKTIYRSSRQIATVQTEPEKPSLLQWCLIGMLLACGFLIIPGTEIGQIGMKEFGSVFTVSFALLCAASITVYISIFVAKNIAFFSQKLGI